MKVTWNQIKISRREISADWLARLIFTSMLVVLSSTWAADNTLPELRTAEQIRRMSAEQAERHYPVRLRGVITDFDHRIFTQVYRFIQDDTAGIYFYMGPEISDQSLEPNQ